MANAGFCVHCGKPYEADERFCGGCGQKLSEVSQATGIPPYPPQAGQMPQGVTPPNPAPYNAQQAGSPYVTQPYAAQPMHAQKKRRAGMPVWGIALMILLPVTVALIVFWQPLMAMFTESGGGGKAEGTMVSAGQPSSSSEVPSESVASSAGKTDSASEEGQTDVAAGTANSSESGGDQKQELPTEPALPIFPASDLIGFYDLYTEITETTENGTPYVDSDYPVGKAEILPVFVSMELRNGAVIHFNQMDSVDGKGHIEMAAIIGDEVSFYDFDLGEDVVRDYQGQLAKDQGSVVINGTFEQTLGVDASDGRVVRGTWRMVSMQPTIFDGVDVSRADKDLPWNEPEGTWTGILTYTGFINLDNTSVFDETVKTHLKGLHNVPMDTSLTFSGGQLKLVIQDQEGGATNLEDFRPVDVKEGWLFTKTLDDVNHPRFLGAVLYRDGDSLRLEGHYTHLIQDGDDFVVLKMRIEAQKPMP